MSLTRGLLHQYDPEAVDRRIFVEFIREAGHDPDLPAFDWNRPQSFSIFLAAGDFLILYSSLSASLFAISGLVPTSLTGRRDLVYLAPLPELCSANRLSISLLVPQYRELSEHRTRYTTHLELPIY